MSADCGSEGRGFKRRRSPYDSQDKRNYAESVAPGSACMVMGLLHSLIWLSSMSAGWGTLWHQAPSMRVALHARGYTWHVEKYAEGLGGHARRTVNPDRRTRNDGTHEWRRLPGTF